MFSLADPPKQKIISAVDQASEDSDEIMEVSPIDGKKKGMQQEEPRGLPRSRNISKYSPDDHGLSKEMEVDPKRPEIGKKGLIEPERSPSKKELKGDEGFINSINQLPDVLKKGTTSSSRGRWSSRGGESSRGGDSKTLSKMRWTAATYKRSAKPPREQYIGQCKKFGLLCLQAGLESYSKEDLPDLSLQIRISPRREIGCFRGKERVRKIDLTDHNAIKKLYVNTPIRKFAIQIAQRATSEADRTVIFVLEDTEDIEDCKAAFKNVGVVPSEAEEKTLDNMSNKLKYWEDRSQVNASEPQETEITRRYTTYEPKKLSRNFKVEIPVLRRSPRRTRACRVENENSKRPRAPSTEEFEYSSPIETQSPKPKLELPKPPWETPLVYPPNGPRKEVIDYDDLKRLNSNSYLNDNIINFYLKYIEVQLGHNNPEVAKETYFLNTFFYERLTKRDDKKKRDIDSVLKWTAKVDIFKTSYIIIPINESTHWYLAIICNLCNIGRKISDKTLDSPGGGDSIDLESSETLIESKSNELDVFSTNTLDTSGVAESLVSMARDDDDDDDDDDEDLEIVATQDNLEHMALDVESPMENEGTANTNDTEIIDVDPPIQRSKFKGRSKLKAKPKSPLKKIKNAMPPDTPSIVILDSMGFGPRTHNGTIRNLREWLVAEAQKKRNLRIESGDIHAAFGKVPNQTNWYDCGLFLLHYVELFFEQPIEFTTLFLAKADRVSDTAFWRKEKIKRMREKLFHLFVQLHDEQEAVLSKQNVSRLGLNENGNSNLNMEEGSKPSPDLMKGVEVSVQGNDVQDTHTGSEPITEGQESGFERFKSELGDPLTPDRNLGERNMLVRVADKVVFQPKNLDEASNSTPQSNRRTTLSFRNGHDGEGVVT
ncbi:hypothetical protein DFP73DRAFT_565605 [Morchella snyderi]|nr:hypothetical protein DFP73DRAFT_565605 [Morchella snyderi]